MLGGRDLPCHFSSADHDIHASNMAPKTMSQITAAPIQQKMHRCICIYQNEKNRLGTSKKCPWSPSARITKPAPMSACRMTGQSSTIPPCDHALPTWYITTSPGLTPFCLISCRAHRSTIGKYIDP